MNPTHLLAVLVAGLLALIPVVKLRAADWPASWLQVAWLAGFMGLSLVIVSPPSSRFLAPVLLVLFVLPFVLGTDRLRRLARRQPPRASGVVIDVTPRACEDAPATGADGPPPGP